MTWQLGKAIWEGYKEDGVPGALNAVNPLYHFARGVADTALAATRGDYRAAGGAGLKTLVLGAATVIGAGRGVGALEARGAAAAEGATLRPYGGPGGGHHVPAKGTFTGAAGYDMNRALAIPNSVLARLGVSHSAVTGAQMTGYRAFAQTGAPLTWEAMSRIETNALVRGGMAPEMANATVTRAIEALKQAGVAGPTRIPWGR